MPGPAHAATVTDVTVTFQERAFAKPLTLSGGTITHVTEAGAQVRLTVAGREAVGHGSIYLSDLWAWPEPALDHDERDAILRKICQRIADDLPALLGPQPAHPLELGLHLHQSCCHTHVAEFCRGLAVPDVQPSVLALAMCASPFDAAIHDAVGAALHCSALDLYDNDPALPTADRWLDGRAAECIRRLLGRPPRTSLPAWWIVGPRDELPHALAAPVRGRGIHCFKLKTMGRDPETDAARTVAVFDAARELGAAGVTLTVDSNEANPDVDSVAAYLDAVLARSAEAFDALAYLEQPTGRDIQQHAHDWRAVSARKPVLLDEGLTSLELLEEAQRQGWSGLALKTCKGHSFLLVAAAWAEQHGLILTLQDLTNPGCAAIHAALLAARLPTVNGVELNSPQFTPEANMDWIPQYAGLFDPHDGVHRLPSGGVVGLHVEPPP